jgi:hypothetical protein
MAGLSRSQWRILIDVFVLCSVLGLSVFLFSPWHKHPRFSSTPCVFSTFEHGACEDVSGHVAPISPPAQWVWLCVLPQPAPAGLAASREAPVRAPPVL